MGAAPQSIANAALEAIRSGLSPAVISMLCGSDRGDALGLHEGGVDCLDELGEVAVVRGDLLVELLVAGREAFERGPGAGSDLVVTGLGV